MSRPVTPLADRFWRFVDQDGPNGCWQWTGAERGGGYGAFGSGGRAGRNRLAHRVAYELFVGPIPEGLHIDHLCRNRGCVNPAHLEPVTPQENVLRGLTLAARNAAKTACASGHPFSADNTYVDGGGARHCRACNRAAGERYRTRKAAS